MKSNDKEKEKVKIRIKKMTPTAKLPTRGTEQAAGYDLYSREDKEIEIAPHSTVMIGTGVAMEIPDGHFGALFARSGMASKRGLRPAECVGVIDSDYRGDIWISFHNDRETPMSIGPNERIAQIVILPYYSVEFEEAEELSRTSRGIHGFGSTGTK